MEIDMGLAFRATGNTVLCSPNNSSVNADFTDGADVVLVTNTGTALVFVRVQGITGAIAATANDVPLAGGKEGIFDGGARAGGVRVSVFSPGSGTVYVTPGIGG